MGVTIIPHRRPGLDPPIVAPGLTRGQAFLLREAREQGPNPVIEWIQLYHSLRRTARHRVKPGATELLC
jgi:hypothetical protein